MGVIGKVTDHFSEVKMANYNKVSEKNEARTELHDALHLTGAEVSVNVLPAGASVPFVHAHKQNEEIYGILEGEGHAEIDGECVPITAGDWLRISPAAKRRFFASEKHAVKYVCIQVKAGSLGAFTASDAIIG